MAPLLRRQATDAAFERLYQRHVKDVYRYAFAVLGERSDAEDVTQTTFLNAYRAFQRGERPQKPQNWLITIAHNVCRQRFRQSQRRPREVEFDDAVGDATVEEPEGPSVEDLRRAFSQLPPNQRAALVMRELEGRSYAEIASVLEISVSALETLLFRARRSLREQLEEHLTCSEAAFAMSRQADGRLSHGEQRALRAHLRACPECASAASRQRAQRRVLKTMLAVPLPPSLGSFSLGSFFGGGATVGAASTAAAAAGGGGVVLKAAAVLTAGVVVGGGAYVGVEQKPLLHRSHPAVVAKAKEKPAVRAVVVPAAAKPRPAAVTVIHAPRRASARKPLVPKRVVPPPAKAAAATPPATVDRQVRQEERAAEQAARETARAERQAARRAEQEARKQAQRERKAVAAAQRREAKQERIARKQEQSRKPGVGKGRANGKANGQDRPKARNKATGQDTANGSKGKPAHEQQASPPATAKAHGKATGAANGKAGGPSNGNANGKAKGKAGAADALPAGDLVAP